VCDFFAGDSSTAFHLRVPRICGALRLSALRVTVSTMTRPLRAIALEEGLVRHYPPVTWALNYEQHELRCSLLRFVFYWSMIFVAL
jgi:hypothetical protein